MLGDLFFFRLEAPFIAGGFLWALSLYIFFSPSRERLIDALTGWLNFAERSLYFSQKEYDDSLEVRTNQNTFYASILSIIPFLLVGFGSQWLIEISLGGSWSLSWAIIGTFSSSIYELGRRATQDDEE
jgi:hypothetical protein